MSERKPAFGEEWTYGNVTWKCIDDGPDIDGRYGWPIEGGLKLYDTTQGMTPPKPKRPDVTKGWRAVFHSGLGSHAWDSTEDIHRDRDTDYLGALNLETGEWVPRP